jgi:hypothetical protein
MPARDYSNQIYLELFTMKLGIYVLGKNEKFLKLLLAESCGKLHYSR